MLQYHWKTLEKEQQYASTIEGLGKLLRDLARTLERKATQPD